MTDKEIIAFKKQALTKDIVNLFETIDKLHLFVINQKVAELTKKHFSNASGLLKHYACSYARAKYFEWVAIKEQNQEEKAKAIKMLYYAEINFDFYLSMYRLSQLEKYEGENLPF